MGVFQNVKDRLFHDKRKRKVIDVPMQAQLAMEMLLHVFVFLALLILILYAEPFVAWFSPYPASTHQNTVESLMILNYPKWPLFVGIALIVGLVSVSFSHRIAGPFYKVNRMMEKYASRDLSEAMYLRKHDYFHSVVSVMNAFRSTVAGDLEGIRAEAKKLRDLADATPGSAKDRMVDIADKISSVVDAYHLPKGADGA